MQALRRTAVRAVVPASRWRPAGEAGLVVAVAAVDLLVWDGGNVLRHGGWLPGWVVPVATLVLYPLLLLRWRYPRAVFTVHWTYGMAGLLMPLFAPFAGLLAALYAIARRERSRIAGAALAACLVPFAVNSLNLAAAMDGTAPVVDFTVALVLWSAITLTVWGLGRLARAAERRAERDRREQAAAAVRAERLHLARELHDMVSHSVSAMILQAAGARALASGEDDQVRGALEAIETTGVDAMNELHRLLGLLRSTDPEEEPGAASATPSLRDLDSLVSSARASGLDVDVVVEGHPDELDRKVGLAAYRIVQEALTNTIKHAGRGASVRIRLRWERNGLGLSIRDRTGFDVDRRTELSSGHGLAGLAERVALVGGSLEAGPVTGGFLLRAHLPTSARAPHRGPAVAAHQEAP